MKKIFTLLFAVGMLSVAQAQYGGNRDNRQNDQRNYPQNNQQNYPQNNQWNNQQNDQRGFGNGYGNDRRFDDKDFSLDRDRKMEIARINQKYDLKIQMVMRNWFMSRF